MFQMPKLLLGCTLWQLEVSGLQIPLSSDHSGPVPSVWLHLYLLAPACMPSMNPMVPMTLLVRIPNTDPNLLPETCPCVPEPNYVSQTLTLPMPSLLIILTHTVLA